MSGERITVHSILDARIFREFALFDNFRRQRRWRPPVLFAGILLVSALLCFTQRAREEQAVLLGGILLAVGFGLPAVYFFNFFLSLKAQIRKLGLDKPSPAYTLVLDSAEGVRAATRRETAAYRWEELYGAYRVKNCIYLYVSAKRAYLLPEPQIEGGADALWRLLQEKISSRRLLDCRR